MLVDPKPSTYGMHPLKPAVKILVVDDSEDNRFLVSWILKKSGAEIECAVNGLNAVEMASLKDYDAILMDIQMPEMDGFTACRLLRGQGYTGPVIAITGSNRESDRNRCLVSGFNEHLSKPLDPRKLQNTLQSLLKKNECSLKDGLGTYEP